MYSVQYYPWFHVTAVGLGTYYPWIWGHIGIYVHCVYIHIQKLFLMNSMCKYYCHTVAQCGSHCLH
jgi:hypothetical protein